jgi:hypothetical protein
MGPDPGRLWSGIAGNCSIEKGFELSIGGCEVLRFGDFEVSQAA